jgi:hypothetical protein
LHSDIASASSQAPFGSSVMRASREAPCQGSDRLDLLRAGQHAALQLEVLEAVAGLRCLGEAHHRLGRQRCLVAQPEPGVAAVGLAAVRQVGLAASTDVEQVAQHRDLGALLPVAEQRRDRQVEELAEQVEHRRLDRGHDVDRRAQVEGLQPTAAGVAFGEAGADSGENVAVGTHLLALEQRTGVLQRLADIFPPGTSPRPVRPALSVSRMILRVKNGRCAPERFSSMLSWRATGTTRMLVTTGLSVPEGIWVMSMAFLFSSTIRDQRPSAGFFGS